MTDKVPRWLELQFEIDYQLYLLTSMWRASKNRTSIVAMIDESTGYDKKQLKDAKRIMNKIKKLKAEYYSLSNLKED